MQAPVENEFGEGPRSRRVRGADASRDFSRRLKIEDGKNDQREVGGVVFGADFSRIRRNAEQRVATVFNLARRGRLIRAISVTAGAGRGLWLGGHEAKGAVIRGEEPAHHEQRSKERAQRGGGVAEDLHGHRTDAEIGEAFNP